MYISELKDRLDTQRELDIVEQNTLKQETGVNRVSCPTVVHGSLMHLHLLCFTF